MESPPLARYIPPPKSKKRVFPGSSSSSSSYMEPEVIQSSPPKPWSSRSNSDEQGEIIYPEVIDIEMDEDSGDFMGVDDKIDTPHKGKEVLASFSYSHRNSAKPGSKDAVVQSSKKLSGPGSHNSFDLEGFTPSLLDLASHGEDDYMDMYHDDLTYDDKYAFLQAHFDSMDTPPGVEAPVPWFSESAWIKKNPSTETGKKSTSVSSSSSQTQMDSPSPPYGMVLPPSWSFSEEVQNEMKSYDSVISNNLSSEIESGATNLPSGFPSWGMPGFFHSKKKPAVSGSTTNYNLHNQLGKIKLGSHHHVRRKKPVGNGTLAYPKFTTMDPMNLPPGVDAYMSGWHGTPAFMNQHFTSDALYYSSDDADFWVDLDPSKTELSPTAAGCSTLPFASTSSILENRGNENDVLSKFQLFKQFDTVQDCSDHHYSSKGSSAKQPSKTWAKKIQEEWRILEKDLPDTIFVRVYESRMDLLRAVIVGAEGTPYHDGLFFFDVFFPCSYPSVPPLVYYHSGGLRINPNLYNSGKVCLSLLNTWSGSQNEMWVPGASTMLQVLVSIQGLILNAKPYFNEPGFAGMSGSAAGEKKSQQYNENAFILSLKTMLYTMRRPPKHFEDFVAGHFCKYAQDILMACKAYMDGAQVGCLAKVGLQDVAAGDKVWSQFFKDTSVVRDVDAGDKSCSHFLKNALAGHITLLVQTFTQVGAKDCDDFLPLAEKGNSQPTPMPVAANHY